MALNALRARQADPLKLSRGAPLRDRWRTTRSSTKQSEPSIRPSTKKSGNPSPGVDGLTPDGVLREHERFSVELEVSVLSEHNFYAGLAENLSAGGLFIATHKLQKVGAKIELSLRMPDSEEFFQIVAEVRWVRVYNEHSDTSPGLGVRFLDIPPGAASAIERFLGQREPLFFDDD